ncbi:MAG: amylo-alpha-1,6-glucosidase, partial [Patescibacteria group bacterium]
MKKIADGAYLAAIKVLETAARPAGFFASGLPGGYEATWARDSMVASLGASLIGNKFEKPFRKSLGVLSKNQSEHGQIPNAVGDYNIERKSKITFNSIDSTLWYIIGHFVYAVAYKNKRLQKKYKKNIERSVAWLGYQDPNEDKLIVQQPTMDWQDAFPHKYGRVLSTEALYFAALNFLGKKKKAGKIKRVINGEVEKYLSLYDSKHGHYLPWIWKTHNKYREEEHWFDTFGNLMAIVSGLATPKISASILRYIEKEKINRPYPCKAIYPPIKRGSKEWKDYFEDAEAREPYHYLNGGIWPFLGGFYVAALVKTGQLKKAESELGLLAKANKLVK